jgi:DNA invertase Pin-like site-specific DNA recombinase
MKAAIYARLSASDDPANLEQQVAKGRRYAEERGWDVVAEYVEPRVSGFKEELRKRPRGADLWAQAEAGKVDVVIVRHLDRLSRRPLDVYGLRELCHVAAYDQGIDTTRGDRLSLGVSAALAQEESAIKSDRQRAYRERARAAGRPRIGGNRAYGFEPDGVTPRASEQKVIRESARRLVRGASLRSVRRYWIEAGIQNSKGEPVRQNVIRQVLLRGERYGVPEETARRVRAILEDPRRFRNGEGANRRTFALNGLAYCAECGGRMYGTRATRARVPYYRCSAPDGGCGVTSIQAAKLEAYVLAECELHHDVENGNHIEGDGNDEHEAELQAALVEAEARAANKRRDYAEDLIDARTLREALAAIEGRITALRRELADVVRRQPSYGAFAEPVDFDEERAHLTAAIERVDVRKTNRNPRLPARERVTITWK